MSHILHPRIALASIGSIPPRGRLKDMFRHINRKGDSIWENYAHEMPLSESENTLRPDRPGSVSDRPGVNCGLVSQSNFCQDEAWPVHYGKYVLWPRRKSSR